MEKQPTNQTRLALGKLMNYHSINSLQLSKIIHVGQQYLYRLANDQARNPGAAIALKIADFFKISIPQLLGLEPIDFTNRPKDLNIIHSTSSTTQDNNSINQIKI